MNSSPPEDGSYEPEPDEEDTGPLAVPPSEPDFEPEDTSWEEPRRETFAPRFDAPLTVSPRQVQRQSNPRVLFAAAAAIAVIAIGVAVWLLWPSSSDEQSGVEATTTSAPPTVSVSADEARLLGMLPKGYAEESCEPGAAPEGALAQVNCGKNIDPDGPSSATYTLTKDRAGLDDVFKRATEAANRVDCPGNIQSPGPWRRNATPQEISGMLFCGLKDESPTVAWTDDDRLVVNVVHAGPSGPTFPQLYAWWSSHS